MHTRENQSSSDNELAPKIATSASLIKKISPSPHVEGISVETSTNAKDQNDLELKLQFGEDTHQYIRDYINQADQKAAFYFAGGGALFAYLHTLGITSEWLANPISWGLVQLLSFIATIGILSGCTFFLLTIMPRLRGQKKGIIFFNAIQEYSSASEYTEDLLNLKTSDLCNSKFKHIYELSSVCRKKYASITWGFRIGVTGVLAAFVLLVFR